MAKNLRILFFLGLFAFVAVSASAQTGTIKGKITDKNTGEPLIGASVIVQGTTTGASTNLDGGYELPGVNTGSITLEASFIGFQKELKTITVTTDGATVNFELTEDSEMIEELVVIGYGTQKKTDKTGAVANVKAEELNTGRLSDPIEALQGKVAGVVITKKGGDPNGGFSVRIRGASGFTSGTDPLYVVDGVPGVDPTTIAAEEIESFNVLKDASSTAIYGSRGANGVIIITTKSAGLSKGKKVSNVEYNGSLSYDNVAKKLDFLSANQVRAFATEHNLTFIDNKANVDWQDEIYRSGLTQSHDLAFSGADDNSSYRASISHNDITGVLEGSSKQRNIGRLNITQKALNDKLTLQARLSGTMEHNDYVNYGDGMNPSNIIYQAYRRNPTDPVYNTDGTFYETDKSFQYNNPVAIVKQFQNQRDAKRILGNFSANLEIVEGLNAKVNLGYVRDDEEKYYFEPRASFANLTNGLGKREYKNKESNLLETTLDYNKTFSDVHNLNLVGGYGYQKDIFDGFSAEGKDASSDYLTSNNLESLLNLEPGAIKSYKNEFILISFFGRAIYDFNKKYFLTATLRRDGSSKFGNNNEWGLFPSASVGWSLDKEGFMEDIDFIDQLKLRVGYGITGNQEIPVYVDGIYYQPSGTAIDPETGNTVISYENASDVNANPDLKWEENSEINIGLDFGIFNNRISGSFEYYRKMTYDLIYKYGVPTPPNKARYTYANVGEIENNGFEASIQAIFFDRQKFDYKTSFTFATNKPKTVKLSNSKYTIEQFYTNEVKGRGLVGGLNNTQIIAPGYAVGTWWMPEFAGISADGQFLFYTKAGGVTRNVDEAEFREVGDAQPDFQLGWSNYFTFGKNFDASISFRAVVGYEIMNVTKMVFGNPIDLPTLNVLESALDEYNKGLRDNPTISSYYLEDASFLKVDNISAGYNFDLSKFKHFKEFRLFVAVNNVYTFTKYTGLDPELSYSNNSLDFGLDMYDVYPKTRTISFGVNAKF